MRRSALYFVLLFTSSASLACLPTAAAIDARVRAAMAETRANIAIWLATNAGAPAGQAGKS